MKINMNKFENVIVWFLSLALFMWVMGQINNKLYDIREHLNGTCVHENTYNGICRLKP